MLLYQILFRETYGKKKIANYKDNDIVIPYHLYFDDWEPDNALGSHKKLNSIAATYAILPTIPPKYNSLLENILAIQLFKSIDKKFSEEKTYLNLLKECIYIEKEGITLMIEGKSVKVFFVLGLIIGDNLGVHEILGFATSFMANFNCIFCKVHRNIMNTMLTENSALLRTFSEYHTDVENNDVSTSGIKHETFFNKLPNFHATSNYYVDVMHDIYEGVCHYDLSLILNNLIMEKRYFSLDVFNEKKKLFDYGINDIGNISQPVELKHIQNNKFNCSASEMRCFIHVFPLIIGEFIPHDDEVWLFLLKFIQIIDIVELKVFNNVKLDLLKTLITEHHSFYVNYFKQKLKPKHHLMTHYPLVIKESGPVINMWCMRAEGKHKELKNYSNNITSRVNLPFSIMMKQQLIFSNRVRSKKGFSDKIEFGAVHKNCTELISDLKKKNPNIVNENCSLVNWVKFNGNTFSSGLVANIGNFEMKRIVEIKYCISNESKEMYFVVFQLNIESFLSHYQSYKIDENASENCFIINIDQFTSRPTSKHLHTSGVLVKLRDL